MTSPTPLLATNNLSYTTVVVPMSLLHLSSEVEDESFLSDITKDIANHGLYYPLVVESLTAGEWRARYDRLRKPFLAPPEDLKDTDRVLVVVCGNNRLRAATELSYTSIECFVAPTREEATHLCKQMRDHYVR